MELRHIQSFVRIVDSGGITRAAAELRMAQSALSKQIAALERQFGVRLLERSNRGVVPTLAGERLYPHALSMLSQAESARHAVLEAHADLNGVARVGIDPGLAGTLGFAIVEACRRRLPDVSLQLHDVPATELADRLHTGELSLGIGCQAAHAGGSASIVPLVEERLFLVVHPRSELAGHRSHEPAALGDLRLVLPPRPDPRRLRIEAICAAAGMPALKVTAEVAAPGPMLQLVHAGYGSAVLPWREVEGPVRAGQVRAVELLPALVETVALWELRAAPGERVRAAVRDLLADVVVDVFGRWPAQASGVRVVGRR